MRDCLKLMNWSDAAGASAYGNTNGKSNCICRRLTSWAQALQCPRYSFVSVKCGQIGLRIGLPVASVGVEFILSKPGSPWDLDMLFGIFPRARGGL